MTLQAFGLLLVSILANVAVQFLMKIAGTKYRNVDVKDFLSHAWSLITTPEILAGMGLSVVSAIAYFLVLTRLELSIAGPASALIYVFSVAIGYYFFKESIGSIPLLLKRLANRIRGYTNKVRLRGLGKVKSFEPAEAGFVCIAPDFSLRAICKSGMHPNPFHSSILLVWV